MLKLFRVISWTLYILGIGIFIINLITLEYSGFLSGVVFISFGIFFVGSLFMKFKGGGEPEKRKVFTCGLKNRIGRIFCGTVTIVCFVIILASMMSSILYGGSPDFVDGIYCITHRNNFVRELTCKEYNILYTLYQEVFPCLSLLYNSLCLGNTTVGSAK